MKSKQFVAEEEAKRFEIEQQRQGESKMVIGGHIPKTDYDSTLKWLTERSKQGAANKMAFARYLDATAPLAPIPGMEPPPRQPVAESPKKEWGDEVADTVLDPLTGKIKKVARRWFGING